MSSQIYRFTGIASQLARLSRTDLFAGLYLLGCTNGLAARIGQSIMRPSEWLVAILGTFKISIIVFAACFAGVSLVFRDRADRDSADNLRSADLSVAGVFLILVILPFAPLSWLAVTALSLYILLFTSTIQTGRRGAIILSRRHGSYALEPFVV